MKILVVDDFALMRKMIKNLLNDLGYTDITEADDGKTGGYKLNEHKFDLVIADWNMRNMSGIEFLKYVRGDKNHYNIPLLMVVPLAGRRDKIIEAARAGVNGFITRPFTAVQLKVKIDKITTKIRG